jgi:hypothetical protein
MLGRELFPGWQPFRRCLNPFREEKHESFGVSDDGQVYWDNKAGTTGNIFHFYAEAKEVNLKEAFKALLAMAESITGGRAMTFTPAVQIQGQQRRSRNTIPNCKRLPKPNYWQSPSFDQLRSRLCS